jgi:hypothetical protein
MNESIKEIATDSRVDDAARLLNELLQVDPKAVEALLEFRVDINEKARDLGLQLSVAGRGEKKTQLSILGLLNGLLLNPQDERIAMVVDNGECEGFTKIKKRNETPK